MRKVVYVVSTGKATVRTSDYAKAKAIGQIVDTELKNVPDPVDEKAVEGLAAHWRKYAKQRTSRPEYVN